MVSFIFNHKTRQMEGRPTTASLLDKPEQEKNFPIGAFFSRSKKKAVVTFRQGELFTINIPSIFQVKRQILTNHNLGCTELYANHTLIV